MKEKKRGGGGEYGPLEKTRMDKQLNISKSLVVRVDGHCSSLSDSK